MTQKDITYQDKLNELRLDLSHPNSAGLVFVLLEGETDIRLFRKFFNLDFCKVERVPGGNSKVEDCVTELLRKHKLVVGIRDADFINLENTVYSKSNIFLTDFHDIEMTIISDESSFSAVVMEFTDVPEKDHNKLRDNIITSIEQISLLKWLNEIETLEISFEKTGYLDLVSFANSNVDFKQYFSRLLAKSPNAKVTDVNIILSKIQTLAEKRAHPFQLCNGHDFVNSFSHYLRTEGKANGISKEVLSSTFRIKFGKEDFAKTNLFQKIKQWADSQSRSEFVNLK